MLEFIRDTVIGMAADAAAPWYAIIANKTKYGEISKDTPDIDALP